MATDLDEQPEIDRGIQDHYDREFAKLTSPENYSKTATPEELASSESSAFNKQPNESSDAKTRGSDTGDSSFGTATQSSSRSDNNQAGPITRKRKFLASRRSKMFAIGGVGIAGGSIALILFLSPLIGVLKINSIMEQLQTRAFATTTNATSKVAEKIFSGYVQKHVLAGIQNGRCTSTISKNCVAVINGTSPIAKVYQGYRQSHFETNLAEKYGIEFGRDRAGRIYMKAPGLPGGSTVLPASVVNGTTDIFDYPPVKRTEVRLALKQAVADETLWKRVMFRFKVGRYLETKYGVKRCIIACNTRDNFNDKKADKIRYAKAKLVQRVLEPRAANLAIVLTCLMDPACDPIHVNTEDGTLHSAQNGEPTSQTDREIRQSLQNFADRYGSEKLADLLKRSDEIKKEGGFTRYIGKTVAENLAEKLGAGEAAKRTTGEVASKAIPVVGWINLAAQIVGAVGNAPAKIQKLQYVTNAASMVAEYQTYRTVADEVKSGHMDETELGSFVDSLGPGTQDDGGGAAAEATPLYHEIIDGNSTSISPSKAVASLFLGPSAVAATKIDPTNNTYKCPDNKKAPDPSQVVCSNQILVNNVFAAGLQAALDTNPQFKIVLAMADLWNGTIGKLLRWAGDLLGSIFSALSSLIPGLDTVEEFLAKAVAPLLQFMLEHLIPNAVTDNMDGGMTFDAIAGGSEVAGSDYAHNGLGGQLLTAQQAASITNEELQSEQKTFQSRPLFARMFATDTPYSFVSRLAVSLPATANSGLQSFASYFLRNPLQILGQGFATLLSPPKVFAADTALNLPSHFGVKQYGYPDGTIPDDLEAFWDAHCTTDDYTIAWNNDAADNLDSVSYLPTNKTTNACLLIASSATALGATTNDSLLSADDLASSTTTATATTSAGPIDTRTLFQDSSSVRCASGTNDIGVYDGYHDGIKVRIRLCAIPELPSTSEESNGGYGVSGANGKAIVNSRVSANFLALVQAAKKANINLTANSSFRSMAHQEALCPCDGISVARPGYSNHQMGIAIDFGGTNVKNTSATSCQSRARDPSSSVWTWLNNNAAKFGIKQYQAESWHWDAMGGSTRCGGDGT